MDPHGGGISPGELFPWNEADRMFTLLVKRAAELDDCHPGSPEEEEFDVLAAAIEAYEAKRWPEGQNPRGAVVETSPLKRNQRSRYVTLRPTQPAARTTNKVLIIEHCACFCSLNRSTL
jgi:hypothetical protein